MNTDKMLREIAYKLQEASDRHYNEGNCFTALSLIEVCNAILRVLEDASEPPVEDGR